MNLGDLSPSALRHVAYEKKLRQQAIMPSMFDGLPVKDLPSLTEEQKLKNEIETMKRRIDLAHQALNGDLDGYDSDWD